MSWVVAALELLAVLWLGALAVGLVRLQRMLKEVHRELSDRYGDPNDV